MDEPIIKVQERTIFYVFNGDPSSRENWIYNEAIRVGIYYTVYGKNFVRIEKFGIEEGDEVETEEAVVFPLNHLPEFIFGLQRLLKDAGIHG